VGSRELPPIQASFKVLSNSPKQQYFAAWRPSAVLALIHLLRSRGTVYSLPRVGHPPAAHVYLAAAPAAAAAVCRTWCC
jgi:hypothetical protein